MSLALVPQTSRHHFSKKTVWRASSTIWVERKISISGVGAAQTKGARVAVTRSSPLKKRRGGHRGGLRSWGGGVRQYRRVGGKCGGGNPPLRGFPAREEGP